MTTFFKDNILFIVGTLFLIGLIAGASQLQHMQNEADTPQTVSTPTETTQSTVGTTDQSAQQPDVFTPAPAPATTPAQTVKPSIQRRYNEDDD